MFVRNPFKKEKKRVDMTQVNDGQADQISQLDLTESDFNESQKRRNPFATMNRVRHRD